MSTIVPANWPNGRRVTVDEQEDDGQAGEQDRQGDLVRRALALGALDEGDHPVEERLARVGGDRDDEAVAGQGRAAGHAAADVRAGLLEDRRGLAGDRRLVDEAEALDDVAVTGDRLALRRPRRRRRGAARTSRPARATRRPGAAGRSSSERVRRRVAAWARPRASATASAYVAKRTVNHSQTAIWTWKPRPAGPADGWKPVDVGDRDEGHEDGRDLDHEHDRVLGQQARIELAERLRERGLSRSGSRMPRGRGGAAGRLAPPTAAPALEAAGAAREVDGTAEEAHGSEDLSGVLEELLDDRSQRERREEVERADDDDDADRGGR